jgi:hypothetical protein
MGGLEWAFHDMMCMPYASQERKGDVRFLSLCIFLAALKSALIRAMTSPVFWYMHCWSCGFLRRCHRADSSPNTKT